MTKLVFSILKVVASFSLQLFLIYLFQKYFNVLVAFKEREVINLWIFRTKAPELSYSSHTVGAVLLSPAVMWKERVDMILVDRAGMLDSWYELLGPLNRPCQVSGGL